MKIITKNKISFKKFLNTNIKFSDMKNLDFLKDLFEYLYDYINNINNINNMELLLTTDKDSFFKYFLKFIYNEYFLHKNMDYIVLNEKNIIDKTEYYENLEELFEYFNLKYSEDILNIFIYFKKMSNIYNVSLFNSKNDTSYPFIEFIFYNYDINETEIEESDLNEDDSDYF